MRKQRKDTLNGEVEKDREKSKFFFKTFAVFLLHINKLVVNLEGYIVRKTAEKRAND